MDEDTAKILADSPIIELTADQSVIEDPYCKSPHEPGAKLDNGKLRLGLVINGFSRALQAVGAVGTYGAAKYTDNGWVEVPGGIGRYTDAMYRHLLAEAAGEDLDPESELLHAAHAAWNALARLELILRQQEAEKRLAPDCIARLARIPDHNKVPRATFDIKLGKWMANNA